MPFRSSTIRGLIVLIVVNVLIYATFFRRISPNNQSFNIESKVFYTPSISENQQSISLPSVLKHAPMHDELTELQFYPVR
jgi:hypothetical protein